jgi:predicted nucleic acid-binding protein
MVLYLDTSALLKRYVAEPESKNVLAKMDEARAIAPERWRRDRRRP